MVRARRYLVALVIIWISITTMLLVSLVVMLAFLLNTTNSQIPKLNRVSEMPTKTIETTGTPKDNEFTASKNIRLPQLEENGRKVENYLAQEGIESTTGIYFIDLNNERLVYSFNEEKRFYPASTYKLPLAMLVLKSSEKGQIDLNKKVYHERRTGQASNRTLREILELMIKESDNDSMGIFEQELGGYEASQELMEGEFGVRIERRTQITTPETANKVLKVLYNDRYLSEQNKNYLIDLMRSVDEQFRDRLIAAAEEINLEYNKDLVAASKIGNLTGKYHDTGIIYGQNSDYALSIFTTDRQTHAQAAEQIRKITKILLQGLEY
ncbi:MAG: serine hydrolase [Candidatus Dojkabacteria bacterium]